MNKLLSILASSHFRTHLPLLLFSCKVVSDSLQPHEWQHVRLPISWNLLKRMFIESVMPSNLLILCPPLLLPSVFPSIRVFSSDSALHSRWPTYWRFSFSTSLSNEYSGLISFWMDWFDFLAVQGSLKSFLTPYNSVPTPFFCP